MSTQSTLSITDLAQSVKLLSRETEKIVKQTRDSDYKRGIIWKRKH